MPGLQRQVAAGAAVKAVMDRMNRASSLYQMYGVLVDVIFKVGRCSLIPD